MLSRTPCGCADWNTNNYDKIMNAVLVAPHAGARIETSNNAIILPVNSSSHPMRVRGLKHKMHNRRKQT